MEESKMKIAVLSGKGGTGKTFISVNLAAASPNAIYVDCDVEEPNGHIFFKPQEQNIQSVSVMIPVVDQNKCSGCRKCVEFCKFNALAYISEKVIVFDDVCHSCGGCVLLCPDEAISEKEKVIGEIKKGISENVKVMTGMLKTGEATGIPIIKKLISDILSNSELIIIDCPPGSSCVVMESIKDVDFCILVAEPTLFGTHNLKMVYELVRLFHKPFGVVLNKCIEGENPSEEFCIKHKIPILEQIPYCSELGSINSNGLIAVRKMKKYKDLFSKLFCKVNEGVQNEKIANP
jgi:MinD superfamily P-loop ATPase